VLSREEMKTDKKTYTVNDELYQRFPVKNQAFAIVSTRDMGEPSYLGFLEKMHQRLAVRMEREDPGFSREENAQDLGANALNLLLGSYGFPNHQFLKWEPLIVPEPLTKHKTKKPPEELTEMVKKTATLYGSDLTGISALDEKWIYSKDMDKPFIITEKGKPKETEEAFYLPKTMNRAIVMGFLMDEPMISNSPELKASTATSFGYSRMGITAVSLAEYIRALGYQAIPSMNDTAMSIPLAVDAGLGQLGRHGLLITPEYGSNIRLAKVITDMPLDIDQPVDFGITEFCENCFLCADHCPSDAISRGEPTMETDYQTGNPGVSKWFVHAEECLKFWQDNGASCINCITVCPFTFGFESMQCFECERCAERDRGCILQNNTQFRVEHGFLKQDRWADRGEILPPRRRGL